MAQVLEFETETDTDFEVNKATFHSPQAPVGFPLGDLWTSGGDASIARVGRDVASNEQQGDLHVEKRFHQMLARENLRPVRHDDVSESDLHVDVCPSHGSFEKITSGASGRSASFLLQY